MVCGSPDRGALRRACEELGRAEAIRLRGGARASGDDFAATGVLCAALASGNRTVLLPAEDERFRAIATLLGLDGLRFEHAPTCDGFLLEVDLSPAGMPASTISLGPNAGDVDCQIQVAAARTLWAAVAVAAGVILLTLTKVQARIAYALDDVFIDTVYGLAEEARSPESVMADRSVLEMGRFVLGLDALAPLGPAV